MFDPGYDSAHQYRTRVSGIPCPISRKTANLNQFLNDEQSVIAATNALGMGINVSNVRLIVHTAPPRTLVDYVQESGRAGRDGAASRLLLLIDPLANDAAMDLSLRTWIRNRECRRIHLERVLDGQSTRVQYQGEEEPCDIHQISVSVSGVSNMPTRSRHRTIEISPSRTTFEAQQQRQLVHENALAVQCNQAGRLERALTILQEHGLDCFLCGWFNESWHRRTLCRDSFRKGFDGLIDRFKRTIRFAVYTACYGCGFP